jgi:hypothetical protein
VKSARRFRYCADPLALAATAAYVLNRAWLAPRWGQDVPFLTAHFADLLLVPVALPLLLWLQRRTGLRTDDRLPSAAEIFTATAVWALLLEVVLPPLLGRGVADPRDVLAYFAGAVVAWGCWARSTSARPGAPSLA